MKDFKRTPARVQAVRLPLMWVWVRRLCYVLAQPGNPTL